VEDFTVVEELILTVVNEGTEERKERNKTARAVAKAMFKAALEEICSEDGNSFEAWFAAAPENRIRIPEAAFIIDEIGTDLTLARGIVGSLEYVLHDLRQYIERPHVVLCGTGAEVIHFGGGGTDPRRVNVVVVGDVQPKLKTSLVASVVGGEERRREAIATWLDSDPTIRALTQNARMLALLIKMFRGCFSDINSDDVDRLLNSAHSLWAVESTFAFFRAINGLRGVPGHELIRLCGAVTHLMLIPPNPAKDLAAYYNEGRDAVPFVEAPIRIDEPARAATTAEDEREGSLQWKSPYLPFAPPVPDEALLHRCAKRGLLTYDTGTDVIEGQTRRRGFVVHESMAAMALGVGPTGVPPRGGRCFRGARCPPRAGCGAVSRVPSEAVPTVGRTSRRSGREHRTEG
jgi:hypothetical protein